MAHRGRHVRPTRPLHPDRRQRQRRQIGHTLLTDLDAAHVLADKAYDGHASLDRIEAAGAQPIIPQRTCMPRKRAFDPIEYKLRNRIERTIGRLKQRRRIAIRYDRIPQNHLANLYIAALSFWC